VRFSVLTAVHDPDPRHLEACLGSVRGQRFKEWEHVVVDDGSTSLKVKAILERAASDTRIRLITRREQGGIVAASQDALAVATGDAIALLDHDDELDKNALTEMSAALEHADVAYSDHDMIFPDGRHGAPYYKPHFSPERLRNQNYILHFVAAKRALINQVGGFRTGFDGAQDHDLLLRLAEATDRIAHVPHVLYHWRQSAASVAADPMNKPWAYEAGRRAVAEHCERVGIDADVDDGVVPGVYRIRRRLAAPPRISVVIPTRGSVKPVWGVPHCLVVDAVESLLTTSTYPDIEIVVVHDAVVPDAVLRSLTRVGGDSMRLVRFDAAFNFSEKINVGVQQSTGELVLVLNDDTQLIEPGSLEVMAAHLEDPTVGMVGAKLLFADGSIQDAGHVYNGHLLPGLSGWRGDGVGPWQLRPLLVEREVSGVTAAAAMTTRRTFDALGGFDESMPVAFNDVDFSLKLRAAGKRIIWTPHASWYHFESQTRAPSTTDEEFDRIDKRWHHEINNDPYYNPNLAPLRADWLELPFRSGEPLEPREPLHRHLTRHVWTRVRRLTTR
jgi:GT2 family glycosyltransferase